MSPPRYTHEEGNLVVYVYNTVARTLFCKLTHDTQMQKPKACAFVLACNKRVGKLDQRSETSLKTIRENQVLTIVNDKIVRQAGVNGGSRANFWRQHCQTFTVSANKRVTKTL